jgi:hypothetical protein
MRSPAACPKRVIVLLVAILSVPAVFVASALYLQAMVEEEFRTGARVSTDGDTIAIPAVGITAAWTLLLVVAGAITSIVMLVKAWRRRSPHGRRH